MYIGVNEAAEKLNLSARTIRNYCASGKITGAYKVGKTWFIPSDVKHPTKLTKRSVLEVLLDEKRSQNKNGLYHITQIELAYNSNHIEGSSLTEEETFYMFTTKSLIVDTEKSVSTDDIIATTNHFRAFDFILDNASKKLTEKLIKEIHYYLKRGTSDEGKAWVNIGEYKLLDNTVGNIETSSVVNVAGDMKKLLYWYNNLNEITVEDIIEFHIRFERIHPFQDGNGRVGRLIMFKECLKHNITPFIILDELKVFYYRGLKEWDYDRAYLIDTCLTCQDKYQKKIEYYLK